MSRRFLPSRLGGCILLYFLCSFLLAAALFFVLQLLSNGLIDWHFNKSSVAEESTVQEVESFQTYVSDNGLATGDIDAIQSWVNGEKYVLMNIYKENFLVYSSSAFSFINFDQYEMQKITPPWRQLYDVTFADGASKVDMIWLAASNYYDAAEICNLSVSFICFVLIFLILINRKISYINRLANELKILEGGNLHSAVTVKGKDELTFLAQGIDEMRKSFLAQMRSEREAHAANSELITSISHDLRTPLTVLIGFLDIIACKKYTTQEQLCRYIESSREKAYQIKELSDKLFEYFLVYGGENREPALERFDSCALFPQLMGEYALVLEDRGFTVKITSDIPSCIFEANLISIRRVFDNLFNNVRKYADVSFPVVISFTKAAGTLSVAISNTVETACPAAEGTGIGIRTCEKIMSQHHGSITTVKSGHLFEAVVNFPMYEKPADKTDADKGASGGGQGAATKISG